MIYQVRLLIPRDYKHVLKLDKFNGNSKWYDATNKELGQINEYQVIINHGKAKYDPKSNKVPNAHQGYQKVIVHLVLACNHDGDYKARLVAGGHLILDPVDSINSGEWFK